MPLHLALIAVGLIISKAVLINFEVFRRLKRKSIDRSSTLEAIDEEIQFLAESLGGRAGDHAQSEIDRLE